MDIKLLQRGKKFLTKLLKLDAVEKNECDILSKYWRKWPEDFKKRYSGKNTVTELMVSSFHSRKIDAIPWLSLKLARIGSLPEWKCMSSFRTIQYEM